MIGETKMMRPNDSDRPASLAALFAITTFTYAAEQSPLLTAMKTEAG